MSLRTQDSLKSWLMSNMFPCPLIKRFSIPGLEREIPKFKKLQARQMANKPWEVRKTKCNDSVLLVGCTWKSNHKYRRHAHKRASKIHFEPLELSTKAKLMADITFSSIIKCYNIDRTLRTL